MTARLFRTAAVAALLGAAACSDAGTESLDEAARERGRAERAFWERHDVAKRSLAAGDTATARTAYRDALALKPDHPSTLYALAGMERRAGAIEDALALCDRLLETDRPRTRAFLLRAEIRSDVEAALASGTPPGPWFDLAAAEADAAAAEEENPEETGPHVARARIALLRGDLACAETSALRAATIHPGHAEAMVLLSVAARRRGDDDGARDWVLRSIAATKPKEQTLPPGEGDTKATLEAVQHLDTGRLRALAAALELDLDEWPDGPPARPEMAAVAVDVPAEAGDPLRAVADFDGDGAPDEIAARRATERDALLSLFGVREAKTGSFTLRLGGRDATPGSGLDGVAACVARLAVADADGDGDPDVLVLPGEGNPARREPPLLLRNRGGGRFDVVPARLVRG